MFCGEQGVSREADRDGRDGEATHLVAVEDGRVLGTCRLLFRRRRRAARAPGRGAGGPRAAASRRRSSPRPTGGRWQPAPSAISLHAQTRAIALYLRDGYPRPASPFVEEGIEHVAMEKPLA